MITILFLIIGFMIIGAYSTTDIIRLSSLSGLSVTDSTCRCGSCGHPLKLREQIPVFSYLLSRGRCRHCGAMIPPLEMILECCFTLSFTIVAFLFHFSNTGLAVMILIYETAKIIFIIIFKPRKNGFPKEFLLSLLQNIPVFMLTGILLFFCRLVL